MRADVSARNNNSLNRRHADGILFADHKHRRHLEVGDQMPGVIGFQDDRIDQSLDPVPRSRRHAFLHSTGNFRTSRHERRRVERFRGLFGVKRWKRGEKLLQLEPEAPQTGCFAERHVEQTQSVKALRMQRRGAQSCHGAPRMTDRHAFADAHRIENSQKHGYTIIQRPTVIRFRAFPVPGHVDHEHTAGGKIRCNVIPKRAIEIDSVQKDDRHAIALVSRVDANAAEIRLNEILGRGHDYRFFTPCLAMKSLNEVMSG